MKLSLVHKLRLNCAALLLFSLMLIASGCGKNDQSQSGSPSMKTQEGEQAEKGSQVVVEVNGAKLTQDKYDKRINLTLETIKDQLTPEQIEQVKSSVSQQFIEYFITRMLLKQEVDKQNITVSDEKLETALNEAKKSLPQGMTLDTMLDQSGMDMDEMREDIELNLRINKLFDTQIKTDFTPTDEELKKYYADNKEKYNIPEQVHVRHILLKVDAKDEETIKTEKKIKIEDIRKQLLEGGDFAILASEYSECPSGKKGGDLGTFSRGKMVPPFEDAAFSQEVNEIGPVVETPFGYHIIQVLEHKSAEEKTFDDVKDKLEDAMKNQMRQELAKEYLAELRKKATIVYGTPET